MDGGQGAGRPLAPLTQALHRMRGGRIYSHKTYRNMVGPRKRRRCVGGGTTEAAPLGPLHQAPQKVVLLACLMA